MHLLQAVQAGLQAGPLVYIIWKTGRPIRKQVDWLINQRPIYKVVRLLIGLILYMKALQCYCVGMLLGHAWHKASYM